MLISLLLPSRRRPDNLNRLFESIVNTSFDLKNIEVIVRIDDDDKDNLRFLNDYTNTNKILKVIFFAGKREAPGKLWNECWQKANGNIFQLCSDDLMFTTIEWDILVRRAFDKYKDKIVVVWGRDMIHDDCTHPFVHQNWTDTIGCFTPENQIFSNDSFFSRISIILERNYNKKRQYFEKDFTHKHMHPCRKRAIEDETYKELHSLRDVSRQIFRSAEAIDLRNEYAKKLNFFIENFKR